MSVNFFFDINLFRMRNRIMILCTFCAIAIFSSAQEKFSIRGIADEELNNQLLYLCLMDDGEKAKEVILDSAKVKKGKFSFSGVRQTPNIALIKDRDGETYPLILEKGKIVINLTTRTVGGTPLNDTLDVAWKGMQSVINNNKQIVKSNISLVMSQKSGESFREALKRDTTFAAIWRRNVEIDLAQRDSIRAFVVEHQNSLVGVFLLSLEEVFMYYSLLEDMMSEASPVFSQHVLVKDKLEKMRQIARRFEAEREKKMTPEEREEQKKRQAMDAKIKIGERFPNAISILSLSKIKRTILSRSSCVIFKNSIRCSNISERSRTGVLDNIRANKLNCKISPTIETMNFTFTTSLRSMLVLWFSLRPPPLISTIRAGCHGRASSGTEISSGIPVSYSSSETTLICASIRQSYR